MAYSLSILFAAFTTLLLATSVHGLAITFCSSQNTAGDFPASYSIYQSNGLCLGTCADYAYAVLQGSNCWCSDYAPSEQVNTYDCNQSCPGYQADWCGSQSAGLYGYYQLSVAPSGTAGAATQAASSSVSSTSDTPGSFSFSSSFYYKSYPYYSSSTGTSSSLSPPTTRSSVILATPVSSSASSTSATTSSSVDTAPSASSTNAQPATSSPPSTATQPTQIYTSVISVTGQVRTIVVTPTSSANPSSLGQGATSSGGVSTGKVVGIVLGVALGLGVLIGLAVWFWLRRKHRNESRPSSQGGTFAAEDGDAARTIPSRQLSQMSSSGLLGKTPRIMTAGYGPSNSNSNSSSNPRSPDTNSANGVDRRSLGTDQRLNPYALFAHEEARLSSVSLQDNQDYSRQLRIANPD